MQSLIRSKSAGVTGGRGTAGAGPGRDPLYLRQECPMYLIFFNLFIDPILGSLTIILPNDVFHELFPFIDDIALQFSSPRIIHTTLHYPLAPSTTSLSTPPNRKSTHKTTALMSPSELFAPFTLVLVTRTATIGPSIDN